MRKNSGDTTKLNVNKPKVGKQLLIDLTNDEARPTMTGDIDDVANLVSPSPSRKPGIMNYASHVSRRKLPQQLAAAVDLAGSDES